MREASLQDKAIKIPHLLFIYPLASGNWSAQNLMKMENQLEEMVYETPCVKMIEVEVAQGFALCENVENPRRGDRSDW